VLGGSGQWMVFYPLGAKPYSADSFCALALLASGVWEAEETDEQQRSRTRTLLWWVIASLAQWVSFAATLVTPAAAAVLFAVTWRRRGWRSAATVAAQGLIWAINFGAHYALSIRYSSNDQFLRTYWASGFPPADGGVEGAARWLISHGEALAAHPGGTALSIAFWLTALYGIGVMLVGRPVMGLMVLSVPVTGFLAAILRVVPFTDRLALWVAPALYAAITVAAGDVFSRAERPRSRAAWAAVAVALVAAVSGWAVCLDIAQKGRERVIIHGSNHGLDDGRGVRMLMAQQEPGEVLLTPHFGLPALWWYGGINTAEPHRGAMMPESGLRIFEIRHRWFGSRRCGTSTRLTQLSQALAGATRAKVYLGFDSNMPPGFQQLVLGDLARLGTRVFYTKVADEGIAAIYDLRQLPDAEAPPASQLQGCVGVAPARRW